MRHPKPLQQFSSCVCLRTLPILTISQFLKIYWFNFLVQKCIVAYSFVVIVHLDYRFLHLINSIVMGLQRIHGFLTEKKMESHRLTLTSSHTSTSDIELATCGVFYCEDSSRQPKQNNKIPNANLQIIFKCQKHSRGANLCQMSSKNCIFK